MRRRWRIPLDDSAPGRARRALASVLGHVLPTRRLDDVLLGATELVSNAVRHSGAEGEGNLLMEVDVDERAVRVDIEDPGPGFDPAELDEPAPLGTSGFGLHIVERIADRWGVYRGRGRVWFAVDV